MDDESKLLVLDFDDLFESLLRSQNHTHIPLLKVLPRSLRWNVYFFSFRLMRSRFFKSCYNFQVLVLNNHTLN